MAPSRTLEEIERLRDLRYHRTPELRLHTEAQARHFVDGVGFCFLFGEQGVEIPTLWAAITRQPARRAPHPRR